MEYNKVVIISYMVMVFVYVHIRRWVAKYIKGANMIMMPIVTATKSNAMLKYDLPLQCYCMS